MFLIFSLITALILIVGLSYFLPFLKERPSVKLAHSKLRIFFLSLFLIAFPIVLVFSILYRLSIDGWRVIIFWLTNKPLAIFYSLSLLFVFLTGIIVPSVTVFHFVFSYKLFLRRQEYEEIQAGLSGDNALMELRDLFFECAKIAGVERTVRFLVVKSEAGEIGGFSGCGIVGKGKKLALLIGSDFVNAYKREKLDKETVRNIFLHEASHIKNRDYFLPLWARQMVRTRAFTFAIVSFLVALLFMVVTIAFTSRGISTLKSKLWIIIALPVVVPSALFAIKGVVWDFIGSIMREREYLADNRAAFFYSTPEGIANAIKKTALSLPKQGDFSASLPFHGTLGKINWHPSEVERIEALGLGKGPPSRKVKPVSPLMMVALNLLYAGILGFLALAWAFPGCNPSLFVIMALLLSFTFILAMATENVFPMRFLEKEVFQKELVGFEPLNMFSRFFTSKVWARIHLNNLVTALTICSLTALSNFVFPRDVTYIHWHKAFFFKAVLFYYLFCTVLSVLLVAIYWSEKKKPPGKGEVPIEMVVR